jgi:hypothetical protein
VWYRGDRLPYARYARPTSSATTRRIGSTRHRTATSGCASITTSCSPRSRPAWSSMGSTTSGCRRGLEDPELAGIAGALEGIPGRRSFYGAPN